MNDMELIQAIASRAAALYERLGMSAKPAYIAAELHIVHSEITPLRLQDFLNADDGNFAHDIGGIHRHLECGPRAHLSGGFCPRFAV